MLRRRDRQCGRSRELWALRSSNFQLSVRACNSISQASGSYARLYHLGAHYGTFEFGAKIRNAHKFDDTYDPSWSISKDEAIPVAAHPEWNSNFTDPGYYDKTYHIGPVTDYSKVRGWVLANNIATEWPGVNSNNYDLIERIPAGYVMNTIELTSRLRFVAGVRFEATHVDTLSFDRKIDPPRPP